tara:strand:- start:18 stop:191 length:174 start_codon:yes stop_codon:yes gene_type:complete
MNTYIKTLEDIEKELLDIKKYLKEETLKDKIDFRWIHILKLREAELLEEQQILKTDI